jgi:hypothetical protein
MTFEQFNKYQSELLAEVVAMKDTDDIEPNSSQSVSMARKR